MNNFWTLVRFELKKILQKKLTWIAVLGVSLTMLLFAVSPAFLTTEDITGERILQQEVNRKNKEAEKVLVGKPMDDAFYAGMVEALQKQETDPEGFRPYKDIYDNMFRSIIKNYGEAATMTEFMERRDENIEKNMDKLLLAQKEKEYWQEKKEAEELPWIFDSTQGIDRIWAAAYTLVVLMMPMVAACLAPMFSEEHQKKTDQLILCTKSGRKVIFRAKFTAGMLFTIGSSLLVMACTILPILILQGTSGLNAPVQLYLPTSLYMITYGEAILLHYGLCLLAMVMYAALAMCLSELFHTSPVPVMAIFVVMLLVGMMIYVPEEWRTLSMLFELQPVHTITVWAMFDYRLFSVFGLLLTKFQTAFVLYSVLTVLFVWIGKNLYLNYQVSGR